MRHCDVRSDPGILPNDPILLQQMLRELYAENDKLRLLIQGFTRPFSSSRRLVRVLRPVIQSLVPTMLDARHQFALGGTVARQLVGDHHARRSTLPPQKLAQKPLRGLFVGKRPAAPIAKEMLILPGRLTFPNLDPADVVCRTVWEAKMNSCRRGRPKWWSNLVGAVVATILLFQVAPACAKDWTALRLGTDPTSPPQESLRSDGTMEGFDIDLAADICTRMNAKCEWIRQDFKDIVPALNAGKFDVIFVGMLMTDNRRKLIDFSIPFSVVRQGLLVQATGPLARIESSGANLTLDARVGRRR